MFVTLAFLGIGIVLFVAGIALFVFGLGSNSSYGSKRGANAIGLLAGSVLTILGLVVGVAAFGWTEIGPGEVGVVVNLGKVDTTEISSGLNWRMPVVSSIHVMDTRIQAYKFGGDAQGDVNKPENQGI